MHSNNSCGQKWLEGAKNGVGLGREAYIFVIFPDATQR